MKSIKITIIDKELFNLALPPAILLCVLIFSVSSLYGASVVNENFSDSSAVVLQDSQVNGMVTDSAGVPLLGANVLEKGTSNGTQTDFDGNFSLNVSDEDAVLVVSFIGFSSKEIPVNFSGPMTIVLENDSAALEEVVVVGYGTQKKSEFAGSVASVDADDYQNQNMTQLSDMLAGTVAGFYSNQSSGAAGGGSMEIRGPTSLNAGTSPMIVLDGAIFKGSLQDINPNDIDSIDILKDASSAAVYGSKAASGVILVTTKRGETGKPTINVTSRFGMAEASNELRALGPDEYIQFRSDFFRITNPDTPYHYYTNPDELPSDMNLDQWQNLSNNPQEDPVLEYLTRLRFFPIEVDNYLAGRNTDWYDVVMRRAFSQNHDVSIGGGTENSNYYWSIGYTDNEGIVQGDEFSTFRSRLNVDFDVTDWLNVGINTQFSDRDESAIPAAVGTFYRNSPFGSEFDEEGNIVRRPHGHTNHPLLNQYRQDKSRKITNLFANMFVNIDLPFDITYTFSFQPRYEFMRDMLFTSTDPERGGLPEDISEGRQNEGSTYEWLVDNLLKWNKEIGVHSFDVTLLASMEESKGWTSHMSNQNFVPTEQLGYDALQYGDAPTISNNNHRYTADALMARLNYTLLNRYLLTASVRRDGYSAFGLSNPRATFPALALGWIISNEDFYNLDVLNRLKLRASWGVNGNRDIGMYAALARLEPMPWYDGSDLRMGVYNSTLANNGLAWEQTESINIGLDMGLFNNRIDLSLNYYEMTTTDLLMNRRLPSLTGFRNITSNLGELQNKGFEMTLNSVNIDQEDFSWRSNVVFSLNRNKIVELFGDKGEYKLLGEMHSGELPDYSNNWFPGRAIDAVWDYEISGVWQENEAETAAEYGMRVGDYKAIDVNNDGDYIELDDKQFIGHTRPRYRIGFGNQFTFLKNFTASVFVRADLGHVGRFNDALHSGWENNDRRSRSEGRLPYWTPENPINDYPRLDTSISGYGGGLSVYKSRSFVRIQDVSLGYNLPSETAERLQLKNLRIFGSIRNLATFTKWPDWDPETGGSPMPRTYSLGLNVTL